MFESYHQITAVLFDLDGTLIDSAPDLAATANAMRTHRGLPELPFETLRPMVGAGARGMLGVALNTTPEHDEFIALRDEFFERYEQRLLHLTRPFVDVPLMLKGLQDRALPWGVVTNKMARFGEPITQSMSLFQRCGVHIYGDTTAHSKPHPEPLLEAARRLNVAPHSCVYVGDDLRDVQAGRAAGMFTLAAAWGYLGQGEAVEDWGADAVVQSPLEVFNWLGTRYEPFKCGTTHERL
jgi:phosphoglycolate phosphatase